MIQRSGDIYKYFPGGLVCGWYGVVVRIEISGRHGSSPVLAAITYNRWQRWCHLYTNKYNNDDLGSHLADTVGNITGVGKVLQIKGALHTTDMYPDIGVLFESLHCIVVVIKLNIPGDNELSARACLPFNKARGGNIPN